MIAICFFNSKISTSGKGTPGLGRDHEILDVKDLMDLLGGEDQE